MLINTPRPRLLSHLQNDPSVSALSTCALSLITRNSNRVSLRFPSFYTTEPEACQVNGLTERWLLATTSIAAQFFLYQLHIFEQKVPRDATTSDHAMIFPDSLYVIYDKTI